MNDTMQAPVTPPTESGTASGTVETSENKMNNEERIRLMSAVGYIPVLFFVPLFLSDKNAYATFHGRQGLVLTVAAILLNVLGPIVSILIPFLGFIAVLGLNVLLILAILIGAWKAWQGEEWEIPVLGKYAKKIKL